MAAPDLFCLIRCDNAGAAQCRRRRRAIIFKAVAVRLGDLGAPNLRGNHHHRKRETGGPDHGRLESVSVVIGTLASSRIGML